VDVTKSNEVLKELQIAHSKDFHFSSGHVLGSMCTEPHPIAVKAYNMFIDTNLGDPGIFPGTKGIEENVVKMIGKLLHAPPTFHGTMVSGGTEGNLTALWVYKKMSGKKEIIVPKHAHFSFQKALSLMDIKVRFVKLRTHVMDIHDLKRCIGKNTACVIATAGTTDLGLIDPIEKISEICMEHKVPLHVDAAFGGFVIPFLKELGYSKKKFDFELNGVTSISTDPHKMGLSVIPSGCFFVREKNMLEHISVASPCTHTQRHLSLLGTRPGASVAATYAVLKFFGNEGYKKVVQHCMDLTFELAKKLKEKGLKLTVEPEMNILSVKVTDTKNVAMKLAERGWKVGVNEENCAIRIVVMPHVKKRLIMSFVSDLQEVIE
jgi:tyrosine decarboxylase/aspartate 1-decarboxylase